MNIFNAFAIFGAVSGVTNLALIFDMAWRTDKRNKNLTSIFGDIQRILTMHSTCLTSTQQALMILAQKAGFDLNAVTYGQAQANAKAQAEKPKLNIVPPTPGDPKCPN